MHTMVLGIAGYSLLLSSSVALIFLLKMGCFKEIWKSQLHVLSTSDTLISMLTSIIILVNQHIFQDLPFADGKITDRQLRLSQEEYSGNETCMSFMYNDSWSQSEIMNENTVKCTFQHILMHYAMFLVPFANAFMTLLIYSAQYSSKIFCVTKKCSTLLTSSPNMTGDLGIVNVAETQTPENTDSNSEKISLGIRQDLNLISRDPSVVSKTKETTVAISAGENTSENSAKSFKYTGFGLIIQWLVPLMITAVLYFSNIQSIKDLRLSSEVECIFKVNFPLMSCHKIELVKVELPINDEQNHSDSTAIIEVEDPDTARISSLASEEINLIVSRVRDVIQSALNETCRNSTKIEHNANLTSWNITNDVMANNLIGQMLGNRIETTEKLADLQQALSVKYQEILENKECPTAISDSSDNAHSEALENAELEFFQDVIKRANSQADVNPLPLILETNTIYFVPEQVTDAAMITRHGDIQVTDRDNIITEFPAENKEKIDLSKAKVEPGTAITKSGNITTNSHEQIYADIIKRIRESIQQVNGQPQKLPDNDTASNSKFKADLLNEEYKSNSDNNSRFKVGIRQVREETKAGQDYFTNNEAETISQVTVSLNKHCFLSTKFLKTHLLILLFLIYFIPVLVSGFLQTRAIYICQNMIDRMEMADKQEHMSFSIEQKTDSDKINTNAPSRKSGWFLNDSHTNRSDSAKCSQANLHRQEKRIEYKNILHETRGMQKLLSVLIRSLLLGTLLWTPAFLEIFSKVFLCTATPAWVVDILYLLGVSFSIAKNFFNVSIGSISRTLNDQVNGKDNIVHPGI